jgi:hypothetical protein
MDGFLLTLAMFLGSIGGLVLFVAWPGGFKKRWAEIIFGGVAIMTAGLMLGEAAGLQREMQRLIAKQSVPYLAMTADEAGQQR